MEQTQEDPIDLKRMQALPIIDPDDPNKKISEKEEKFLREIVNYEFFNLEEPGMIQKFSYGNSKNKYTFTFFHGGKYRIPRFIARHVESKSIPMWNWKPDGMGRMQKMMAGRKSRFQMREVYS